MNQPVCIIPCVCVCVVISYRNDADLIDSRKEYEAPSHHVSQNATESHHTKKKGSEMTNDLCPPLPLIKVLKFSKANLTFRVSGPV